MDPRIQDNVFYVVEDGKNFRLNANGADIYDFMGWATPKALTNIKKRSDANDLVDFLNNLFQFAQQAKQKEIQKVLGIPSKEDIQEMIKESSDDFDEKFANEFNYKVKNSNELDEIIDKKISEHRHEFDHDRLEW